MKRNLFLISLILWNSLCLAGNYRVLYVNDASLKFVDGKVIKVGDVFSDAKDIKWEKEKQAVKAINLSTKRQVLFLGKNWVRVSGLQTLGREKHLSAHDSSDEIYKTLTGKLMRTFESEYDLLDVIEIPTDVKLSKKKYFEATYEYDNSKITKKMPYKKGLVIIDRSLFEVGEKLLQPHDIVLSIEYVDEKSGQIVFVKDGIELNIIPLDLN